MTADTARRMRRWKLLALTLVAPVLLAGCASTPPDPILIGAAPATATSKISLAIPLDRSGFFVFDRWPNACDLLTDEDVRAVFPQATDIRRKAEDTKLTVLPNIQSTVPGNVRNVTVKNTRCRLTFALPGVELEEEFPNSSGYAIDIDIESAGSAEVVRQNHRLTKDAAPISLGGAQCTVSTNLFGGLNCIKGQVAFRLSANNTGVDQGGFDGTRRLRYQVGTDVTVLDRAGTVEGRTNEKGVVEAIRTFQNDRISSELVKAAVSKF